MTGINVELTYEQEEEILVGILQRDFASVSAEIAALQQDPDDLEPFELEDLESLKDIRKAMKRMLRHYMVHEQADKYISFIEAMNS